MILVSVAVVQILHVCTEMMVIMNVAVIQASLEMEKLGCVGKFQKLSHFLCGNCVVMVSFSVDSMCCFLLLRHAS